MFNGTSFTAYALYLFPTEVGIGRFQPYGRYTMNNSVYSNKLDEFEAGTNYVISGHNARISACVPEMETLPPTGILVAPTPLLRQVSTRFYYASPAVAILRSSGILAGLPAWKSRNPL